MAPTTRWAGAACALGLLWSLVSTLPRPDGMAVGCAAAYWALLYVHLLGLSPSWAADRANRMAESCATGSQRGPEWRPLATLDANVSFDEVYEGFVRTRRPVVIPGFLAAHPELGTARRWNLEHLQRRFRDMPVLVKRNMWDLGTLTKMAFGDYAQSILDSQGGEAYLAPANEFFHHDATLVQELKPVVDAVHSMRRTSPTGLLERAHTAWDFPYYMFIAAAGRATQLHCDATTTFYFLTEGRKRFYLLPPQQSPWLDVKGEPLNFAFFSGLANVTAEHPSRPLSTKLRGWVVDLAPGDLLFWPAFTWHYVENLEASVAFSVPAVSDLRGTLASNWPLSLAFMANPRMWWSLASMVALGQESPLRAAYFADYLAARS